MSEKVNSIKNLQLRFRKINHFIYLQIPSSEMLSLNSSVDNEGCSCHFNPSLLDRTKTSRLPPTFVPKCGTSIATGLENRM